MQRILFGQSMVVESIVLHIVAFIDIFNAIMLYMFTYVCNTQRVIAVKCNMGAVEI